MVLRPVVRVTSSVSQSTQTYLQRPQGSLIQDVSVQTSSTSTNQSSTHGNFGTPNYTGWDVYTYSSPDRGSTTANGVQMTCEHSGAINLATQTDARDLASQFLSLGTQTAAASTSNQSSQTQQAGSCEFGTQTCTDFAAQYLTGNLSSVAEFGTQTTASAQSPLSHDRQDSFHDLCVDDQSFCDRLLLPPECMDFGTQTLDEFTCLHDLGVQTLLPAETRDQGSQTSVTVVPGCDSSLDQ